MDYQNLVLAQKSIQQVNTYINRKKKDVDSRQKLTAIQNTVKGCPSLVLAHRYPLRWSASSASCQRVSTLVDTSCYWLILVGTNSLSFFDTRRYYVHEGNIQVSSTDKHKTGIFYFFLFNDMLMATKKAGGLFHHKRILWRYSFPFFPYFSSSFRDFTSLCHHLWLK